MRVYVVFVDKKTKRVGLNIKDATLPAKVREYEGLIGLFGGAVEEGESPHDALRRELEEEVPGFVSPEEVRGAEVCFANKHVQVFMIATDLSGDRKNRHGSRIGELARVCQEGDGVVRSFDYVRRTPASAFVAEQVQEAVLVAIDD